MNCLVLQQSPRDNIVRKERFGKDVMDSIENQKIKRDRIADIDGQSEEIVP